MRAVVGGFRNWPMTLASPKRATHSPSCHQYSSRNQEGVKLLTSYATHRQASSSLDTVLYFSPRSLATMSSALLLIERYLR